MTTFGKRVQGALLATLLLAGASVAAEAQESVWRFNGNCIDCADAFELSSYQATATLTLNGYLGGALNDNHFVKFVYDGSNLIDEYTVTASNFGGMMGNLTGGPFQTFAIAFGQFGFFALGFGGGFGEMLLEGPVAVAGEWATCPDGSEPIESALSCEFSEPADFGNSGAFVLQSTTTVPEPGTYALMTIGLGALGVVMRRRRPQ